MNRDELKNQIDNLMNQYDKEEIDGNTYFEEMMDLTRSYKENNKKQNKDD